MIAFKILTGEAEIVDNDGTFKPDLYDGIKSCTDSEDKKKSHLHVLVDKDYIGKLICKAEHEIKEL